MEQKEAVEKYLERYTDDYLAQTLQAGEFTIRMFRERLEAKGKKLTYAQAAYYLDHDDTLTFREALVDGKACKAYRKK